jgi:hypothetical protein
MAKFKKNRNISMKRLLSTKRFRIADDGLKKLTNHIWSLFQPKQQKNSSHDILLLMKVCLIIASKFVDSRGTFETTDWVNFVIDDSSCTKDEVYRAEVCVLESIDWRPLKGFEDVES